MNHLTEWVRIREDRNPTVGQTIRKVPEREVDHGDGSGHACQPGRASSRQFKIGTHGVVGEVLQRRALVRMRRGLETTYLRMPNARLVEHVLRRGADTPRPHI